MVRARVYCGIVTVGVIYKRALWVTFAHIRMLLLCARIYNYIFICISYIIYIYTEIIYICVCV